MKQAIGAAWVAAAVLTACSTAQAPAIGGHADRHGCLASAGQTWSVLKQQCVQTFNVADIRLEETQNGTTYGVYVILSQDKQQAEVFAVSLPENTILEAVKGGYASRDGSIHLLQHNGQWRLSKP